MCPAAELAGQGHVGPSAQHKAVPTCQANHSKPTPVGLTAVPISNPVGPTSVPVPTAPPPGPAVVEAA